MNGGLKMKKVKALQKGYLKILLMGIAVLTIIAIALAFGYVYFSLNSIKTVKITKTNKALGIKVSNIKAVNDVSEPIINIALFGIDTGREKHEAKHSDSIMILSIDELHNKIKLSSLMRDLYVKIDGHGMNKLNAAYAYGGPELAIKTINENFDMDIKDYVTANFAGLSDIIDAVDGIQINVKEQEIQQINKYMKEVAKIKKKQPTPLINDGVQRLNGIQAVAYARIRKVGNGDFERTERQKSVLMALFTKLKKSRISSYPFIAVKFLSCLETSMNKTDIIKIGTNLLGFSTSTIDWCRFPLDGYAKNERINKIYYLATDLTATTKHIHSFIYDDIKTPPYKIRLALKTTNKKIKPKN
jgi:LCP family protein required for cell wall assembly